MIKIIIPQLNSKYVIRIFLCKIHFFCFKPIFSRKSNQTGFT